MYGSRKPDCEAYTVTKIYKKGIDQKKNISTRPFRIY